MPDKNENDLLAAEVSSAQLRPPSLEKKLEPVLDQWEVERVLLSLESDDEGIRALVSSLSARKIDLLTKREL